VSSSLLSSRKGLQPISTAALLVAELPDIDLSAGPDDNVILTTAIAGEVDLLVTGDKSGLLELKSISGIPIVTPREALRRIQGRR
jgi:predicted nucleic acid-binding protein